MRGKTRFTKRGKNKLNVIVILLLALSAIVLAWFITWYQTSFRGRAAAPKEPGNYPRDVNVLIVRYQDKSDASYNTLINQRISEWKTQIENASKYHGYKNSAATPVLKVNIRTPHIIRTETPPWVGPKPASDSQRYTVALNSFKAILAANNNQICNIINSENIDQVWYMITPDADLNETSGYNMEWYWSHTYDSDPNLALCGADHTWISLTLSTERGRENSLHVLGHFMERMIGYLQTDQIYENRFAGTRRFWGGDPTTYTNNQVCGDVHYSPNAKQAEDDYDYYQPDSVSGNICENWRPNYLDPAATKQTVTSANWNCSATSCKDVDYYNWWFNNMPGKDEEIKYGQKRLPPWFEFLADYDKTLEYYASKPEYYLAQYLEDVAKPSYITDKSISSKDSGSSITWQHEVTGADRLLVISVAYANEHHLDNAPGLTGVKYGTTALTFIRRDSYGGFVTELWYLKNPPLGKKNVVATFPANNSFGGIVATGTTFVGVDQTNPIRRNVGGGSTDTSLPQYGGHPSLDVPGQPGDYIYASLNIFAGEDNAVTREGNTAGLWGRVHGDIYSKGGIQKATSTSTTMEWLSSKHWQWAMSGIAIKPKSTTTPTPTPTPSPTVSPTATPAPNGLIGRYYDNINFTALKLTRTDPRIAFNWKTGTPNSKLAANTFSVRWTGFIKAPVTGKYTFYAQVNDGVRVWVNKTRIINSWTNKTATTQVTGTINLTKGQKYPIRVDYYENTASALINLYWAYPGVTKRIIPTSVLTTK